MHASFLVRTLTSIALCVLLGTSVAAHPGSGIVVDKEGQVFFTDTGQGVWKIDTQGKLTYLPASRFHWMTIDEAGYFAESQKNFGEWFERVTPQSSKPALLMSSDFPLTINRDGNIYYADTRLRSSRIVRRTPDGKETASPHWQRSRGRRPRQLLRKSNKTTVKIFQPELRLPLPVWCCW